MIDYNKRLVEVDEILNYLSEEDLSKIPEDIKQLIKDNKDKEYSWKYDETKKLEDQNLSRDTIAFLSYINMEYLLAEKQKQLMEQIHYLNEQKLENQKQIQYSPDNLFTNNQTVPKETLSNTKNELIIYKENIFSKILNRIKKFFF